MNYKDFTVADFLSDGFFRQWTLSPTDENSFFWENWIKTHPHQQEEIEAAQRVLNGIQQCRHGLPPGKADSIWAAIETGMEPAADHRPGHTPDACQ